MRLVDKVIARLDHTRSGCDCCAPVEQVVTAVFDALSADGWRLTRTVNGGELSVDPALWST